MLFIHPDECVDCGACEPVCPVEAIYYEDDVPDQWSQHVQINADFFEELGSAGRCLEGGHDRERPAGGQGPSRRRPRTDDAPDARLGSDNLDPPPGVARHRRVR